MQIPTKSNLGNKIYFLFFINKGLAAKYWFKVSFNSNEVKYSALAQLASSITAEIIQTGFINRILNFYKEGLSHIIDKLMNVAIAAGINIKMYQKIVRKNQKYTSQHFSKNEEAYFAFIGDFISEYILTTLLESLLNKLLKRFIKRV